MSFAGADRAASVAETDRTVSLTCELGQTAGAVSARTSAVATTFGLAPKEAALTIADGATITIGPGRIILIAGPSGSGKSTVLARIASEFAAAVWVQSIRFPPHDALIDAVAPEAQTPEALATLTACGLGDAHTWLRPFDVLSEGEKFRARLAKAVAAATVRQAAAPLICDEFASLLHRRSAKAVAYNVGKLIRRRGLCLVAATAHEDILDDLRPDTLVALDARGRCVVSERDTTPSRAISFKRRLQIVPGCKRDYERFAKMHYRAADELGFVDKVFLLCEPRDAEPLGIVVYAHPPLELALRNQATDGRFSKNPHALNKVVRILRRLVVHPDVRGCGLGHYLVRRTMPLVGTEFVECLSAMGEFNPVFEKAGMRRVGRYELSPRQRQSIDALRRLGVDPNGPDFVLDACRRPGVRAIVAAAVRDWYAATTGGGAKRVEHQSPERLAHLFRAIVTSRPVYYLWQRGGHRKRGAR